MHQRFLPHPELAPFIRRYEYLDAPGQSRVIVPFAVSVLPLLGFFLKARCEAFDSGPGVSRLLPATVLLGPCDRRVAEFILEGNVMNFVVVFEPTGLLELFRVSPAEVRNRAHDCSDILGREISTLHDQLREARSPQQMARIVDGALRRKLAGARSISRVRPALAAVRGGDADLDLSLLGGSLGFCDRSWRRHFSHEVGVSPRRYRVMRRFQGAIATKLLFPQRSWTRICLEAGYYDQAHFNGECLALTSRAPSQFIREMSASPAMLATAFHRMTESSK